MTLSLALALVASAVQDYRPAFRPDQLDDQPAGAPNEVMVLGSAHLSQLPDSFRDDMVDPLVDRLVAWKPTAVATENISGVACDMMRRLPTRYDADTMSSYCFDPSEAGAAVGLDVPAANAEVERLLADWPAAPTPAQRRHLALLFLAAGEPGSALVQWLRLPAEERHAEGELTENLASSLDSRMSRPGETNLIAAPVAARSGLERLWSVDDQSNYAGDLDDEKAYGTAVMAAWDNPATKAQAEEAKMLESRLGEPGGFLAMYRALNAPSFAQVKYRSDFGAALAEPSQERYGRRYVSYWETRNLRMVANIREVLGRDPGTRMLAIVGASHKGYYEAYLSQMRDVQLVDVMPLLEE